MKAEPARQLQTLVLNADYRPLNTFPLSIISAREAIEVVYKDKVDVVENWDDEFFRSARLTIPVPKTIALRDFAHVHSEPKFCRRSIYLRDRYRCQYCGERFASEDLTFDHLIPRSRGGRTTWDNILTACLKCNGQKANQDADHSGRKGVVVPGKMRPLKMPRQPTAFELMRAGTEFLPSNVVEDWGSWLYWNTELEA